MASANLWLTPQISIKGHLWAPPPPWSGEIVMSKDASHPPHETSWYEAEMADSLPGLLREAPWPTCWLYSQRWQAVTCLSAVKVMQGRAQPRAAEVMLCVLLSSLPALKAHVLHTRVLKWPGWLRSPASHVPRDKVERHHLRISAKQ